MKWEVLLKAIKSKTFQYDFSIDVVSYYYYYKLGWCLVDPYLKKRVKNKCEERGVRLFMLLFVDLSPCYSFIIIVDCYTKGDTE